jgi:hypothetical protein
MGHSVAPYWLHLEQRNCISCASSVIRLTKRQILEFAQLFLLRGVGAMSRGQSLANYQISISEKLPA